MTPVLRTGLLAAALALVPRAGAGADELAATSAEIAKLRADLEDLRDQAASRDAGEAREPLFHIYGFMDAGLQKLWAGEHAQIEAILPSNDATFLIGNISLYLDFHPIEAWSSFVEVSLTNLPDGEDVEGTPTTPYTRTSTQTFNLSAPGGVYSQIRARRHHHRARLHRLAKGRSPHGARR